MEQYQLVSATFNPKRTDDLRETSKKYIGKRFYFERGWHIEEDDNITYAGQIAWLPVDINTRRGFLGWCPGEDLKNVFKY